MCRSAWLFDPGSGAWVATAKSDHRPHDRRLSRHPKPGDTVSPIAVIDQTVSTPELVGDYGDRSDAILVAPEDLD